MSLFSILRSEKNSEEKIKKENRTILNTVIIVNLLDFGILVIKGCISIKNKIPETSLSVVFVC